CGARPFTCEADLRLVGTALVHTVDAAWPRSRRLHRPPAAGCLRSSGVREDEAVRCRGRAVAIVIALVVAVLSGCAGETPDARPSPVREWRTEVVATYPHDGKAFTQGLELRDGMLYEGTGRYGSSWITVSDFPSGTVRERVDLEPELFGEGITLVGDTIWQLTWRNGVALLRDRASLSEIRRVRYQGEG